MPKFPNIEPFGSIGPLYRRLLYQLMMLGMHENVLEIGCLYGYSTSAFLAAKKNGGNFRLSLCDPWLHNNVIKVLQFYKLDGHVYEIKRPSHEIDLSPYDCIFVDGDHRIDVVCREVYQLLELGTKTIIAHDTHKSFEGAMGPSLLRMVFENHKDYHSLQSCDVAHDIYDPPVGFSLFTKDDDVYEKAKPLFEGLST